MRNTFAVILATLTLSGCLDSGNQEADDSANINQPENSAPRISGTPENAILYGDMYQFQPSATDSDGDELSFEVENKPSWAGFDTSTGRLSGQPTIGNIGVFDNIVISVSDGQATASLPAFSITVSQDALGSVSLSWNPPTENTDGSTLQDLAGYKIYYGRDSGEYDHQIRIDNPGLTAYVVERLLPGTYYFAATAFNASGIESAFSGEAVRTVN